MKIKEMFSLCISFHCIGFHVFHTDQTETPGYLHAEPKHHIQA
jgi:hypothetical protein